MSPALGWLCHCSLIAPGHVGVIPPSLKICFYGIFLELSWHLERLGLLLCSLWLFRAFQRVLGAPHPKYFGFQPFPSAPCSGHCSTSRTFLSLQQHQNIRSGDYFHFQACLAEIWRSGTLVIWISRAIHFICLQKGMFIAFPCCFSWISEFLGEVNSLLAQGLT